VGKGKEGREGWRSRGWVGKRGGREEEGGVGGGPGGGKNKERQRTGGTEGGWREGGKGENFARGVVSRCEKRDKKKASEVGGMGCEVKS